MVCSAEVSPQSFSWGGKDDHPVVVAGRFGAEVLYHVGPYPLEVQPLPTGQGDEKGVGLAAVVVCGDVAAVMDIPLLAVEDIVVEEAPLRLGAGGNVGRQGVVLGLCSKGIGRQGGAGRSRPLGPGCASGLAQRQRRRGTESGCLLDDLLDDFVVHVKFPPYKHGASPACPQKERTGGLPAAKKGDVKNEKKLARFTVTGPARPATPARRFR